MYSSVTMILMSLLIPELVHGSCQYIPQETLAIPGKKSKEHLRLQAFMLLKNFRLCDGYKKISLFFDDRIFSMVFCKFFFISLFICFIFAVSLDCLYKDSIRVPYRQSYRDENTCQDCSCKDSGLECCG